MKKRSMLSVTVALAIMVWVLAGTSAFADSYEVTVTNLTRGQWFTPIMVASHLKGVSLFTPGQPASDELALLAEQGDTGPLTTLLLAMPEVTEVGNSGGLLGPGESVTVTVATATGFNNISVAAMLIPTNDAFVALNGVRGPTGLFPIFGSQSRRFYARAYDSGSEVNDELCASIPGPDFEECGGPWGWRNACRR